MTRIGLWVVRRSGLIAALVLTAMATPLVGQEVEREDWSLSRLDDIPVGWAVSKVTKLPDGKIESSSGTYLKLGRLGGEVEIEMDITITESADGKVAKVESVVVMSSQPTKFTGVVDGQVLKVTSETAGQTREFEIPWDPSWISSRVLEQKAVAVAHDEIGTTDQGTVYDPTMGTSMTTTLRKVKEEEIEWGGQTVAVSVVESETDALPGMITTRWIDAQGRTLRNKQPMVGTQFMINELSTQEECIAALGQAQGVPDIFNNSVIRCDRRLPAPRRLDEAVYRVKLREGAEADLAIFANDPRQEVLATGDREVTIKVSKREPATPMSLPFENVPKDVAEGLTANSTLQCDDEKLIAVAREALGGEKDAWTAARKLEEWVYEHIDKKGMDVGFASALEVLEECKGDCSEHSVLLAALCRAVGIPSRVVMGGVYVGGVFGGHAWTEVWVGDWYALDATTAHGLVGAGHIGMVHSFMSDESGMDLFVPLTPLMGGITTDCLSLKLGEQSWTAKPGPAWRVKEGRFHHDLLGVSFDIPEGWELKVSEEQAINPRLLSLSRGAGARIELAVQAVPYSFQMSDLGAGKQIEVDGRRAVRMEAPDNTVKVFILVEDMLYAFGGALPTEADRKAMETILSSYDFDVGFGVGG